MKYASMIIDYIVSGVLYLSLGFFQSMVMTLIGSPRCLRIVTLFAWPIVIVGVLINFIWTMLKIIFEPDEVSK